MALTVHASISMSTLLVFLQLLNCLVCFSRAFNLQCYTPNNAPAGTLPCNPESNASACCNDGIICYSNFLCVIPPGLSGFRAKFFTSDCTDPSFQAPECAGGKLCGNESLSVALVNCGNGSFCCQLQDQDCCFATSVHNPGPSGTSVPISEIRFPWPIGSATATINATAISALRVSATSSAGLTITSLPVPIITTVFLSGPLTSSAVNHTDSNSKNNAIATSLGVGIGLPVSLMLFCGFGYLLYLLRKRRSILEQTTNGPKDEMRSEIHSEVQNNIVELQSRTAELPENEGRLLAWELDDPRR